MAMFESLSKRLEGVFTNLSGKGKLTEADVNEAMREVRLALLEADVSLKVVRQFVERVREKAIGADVLGSFSPAQQVLAIVNEELIEMLGGTEGKNKLDLGGTPPTVIMLVGLQGSGKTTTAAKLANYLRKQGQRPLMVAADMYRPAAVRQLQTLGKQLSIPVYSEPMGADPVDITVHSLNYAREQAASVVILDTAGRLNIDERMMQEVVSIRARVQPREVILVADAMTGQEAVRVADDFNKAVSLTGLGEDASDRTSAGARVFTFDPFDTSSGGTGGNPRLQGLGSQVWTPLGPGSSNSQFDNNELSGGHVSSVVDSLSACCTQGVSGCVCVRSAFRIGCLRNLFIPPVRLSPAQLEPHARTAGMALANGLTH